MTTDLRIYKATVLDAMARALETGKPEALENSGPDHARVVLDTMLENALERVDVVSGKMDLIAWSPEVISGYLNRNPAAQLRVLLDETSDGEIPLGSALHEFQDNDRVQVRWLASPLSWHLCVADAKHVRLEHNIRTAQASITFNDPNVAGKKASKIFERWWATARSSIPARH